MIIKTHFFYPSFIAGYDGIDFVPVKVYSEGSIFVDVVDEFVWPDGCGSFNSAYFLAVVTDLSNTEILGDSSLFEFGWSSP